MTRDEAHAALLQLAREGWLRHVAVFGADACCLHGEPVHSPSDVPMVHSPRQAEECPACGYGLVDEQTAWSDCNRAEAWLMRPDDLVMTTELRAVLADEELPAASTRVYDGPVRLEDLLSGVHIPDLSAGTDPKESRREPDRRP